ncbi:cupin domain-containing protein [Pontivivens ytuae]|uniref:Cupin domain-containing protein n=1 Tax=Pontivivens ytuae TaxID=2789856 RepID=A0A7S9LSK9_9RHOB|nr:cupin domain-containing protein [Pontivivens ytuae]QPH54371.1 cupin domain-containing protein [Pontivivens ytuae]
MSVVRPSDAPRYSGPDAAEPFGGPLGTYEGRAIGQAAGLRHLGANVETLDPGAASSHRHWHSGTDELVVVLDGVLTLIDDGGETQMQSGEIAAFPAGVENGHHLVNRSDAPARFLVVGSRASRDRCHYADLDLVLHTDNGRSWLTRRDGTRIEPTQGGAA